MSERRPLGSITLLALGVNGIVGVGIFVAPPIVAAAFPGASGALVYVAISIACLPVALAYARLARAMPVDGGPALYADRAFGPIVARAVGVLVWVSALFSTAAVTRALAERIPIGATTLVAVALCAVLAAVNLRGLRLSALAWTVLTITKLVPLVLLAVGGLFVTKVAASAAKTGDRGTALLAIMFAVQGFEIVPLPAGQAEDSETSVPRATVLSLVGTGVLYAAVHVACVHLVPGLARSTSPIPAAASTLGGPRLAQAVAIGVLASISGIVVGMHAMTPRYLAAIAVRPPTEEEKPAGAIVVTAVLAGILCARSTLTDLLQLSSVAVLAQYASAAASLLALSFRRREGLVPRDAWPVPFAFAIVVVLLLQAPGKQLLHAAIVVLVSVLIAFALLRRDRPGATR